MSNTRGMLGVEWTMCVLSQILALWTLSQDLSVTCQQKNVNKQNLLIFAGLSEHLMDELSHIVKSFYFIYTWLFQCCDGVQFFIITEESDHSHEVWHFESFNVIKRMQLNIYCKIQSAQAHAPEHFYVRKCSAACEWALCSAACAWALLRQEVLSCMRLSTLFKQHLFPE